MQKPQPSREPISEGFMGEATGHSRATTEIYLPSNYGEVDCDVLSFETDLKNMREMTVRIKFLLKSETFDIGNLYSEEAWKMRSTENFLQHVRPNFQVDSRTAPVFCLMLNKYLRVEDASLKIDGTETSLLFDQSPDIVVLPDSFPPLVEMPSTETHAYYNKKTTVFYAPLSINTIYELTIELDSLGNFEFAPLFPYKNVNFIGAKFSSVESGDLKHEVKWMMVKPTRTQEFPQWLEYDLNRSFDVSTPPQMRAALPFRGQVPLFNLEEIGVIKNGGLVLSSGSLMKSLSELKELVLKNYEVIRLCFILIIPVGKKSEIIVKTIKNPLPIRIYEQLHKLPMYHDVLAEYDIINFEKTKRKFKIETEIFGITDKIVETVTVPGLQNSEKKPARARIRHCPALKHRILETIVSPQKATLYCKVTDQESNVVLFEQSFKIDLLQHDQIVWEIRDVNNSRVHNLTSFICAWVHPTDLDGLLDTARANSIRYHPDGIMGHKTNTIEEKRLHIKALWEYLSNEANLKYLHQPFATKMVRSSQRVVLPERVLKNKAGNCIDLTILFASLLEGLCISSLIFLTPTHAFIGWGDLKKTEEMIFLETTGIGRYTFEQCQEKGRQQFKDQFLFAGTNDVFPDFMGIVRGVHIVDLYAARKAGIISERTTLT